jgi:hypothetical protein
VPAEVWSEANVMVHPAASQPQSQSRKGARAIDVREVSGSIAPTPGEKQSYAPRYRSELVVAEDRADLVVRLAIS